MTRRTRRQFLAATGVTLTAALTTNLARAQLAERAVTSRPPLKVGVAPGYIVSGRGEHSSNPQGQPSNKHLPRPRPIHGKGVMEEDAQ